MRRRGIDSARVRYELLLQSALPGAPFPFEAVDAALVQEGVTEQGEWRLKNGSVEVKPLLEGGARIATELKVPLSDRMQLVRELVSAGAEIARATGTSLVDLQLNRAITEKDLEAVERSFMDAARYAGEMMGVPEALPASYAPPPQSGLELKPGTKVVLAIVALFFFALWVLDVIA